MGEKMFHQKEGFQCHQHRSTWQGMFILFHSYKEWEKMEENVPSLSKKQLQGKDVF
jgi:hypothetical protein